MQSTAKISFSEHRRLFCLRRVACVSRGAGRGRGVELTEEQRERVRAIRAAEGQGFAAQVVAAGLDPGSDFRHANLRGVDFAAADLKGFDFTGADLSGADLSQARVEGACFRDALVHGTRFPVPSAAEPGRPAPAPRSRRDVPVLRDHRLRAARALLRGQDVSWAVMPSGAGKTTVLERVAGELLAQDEIERGVFVAPHRALRDKFRDSILKGLPGLDGRRGSSDPEMIQVASVAQMGRWAGEQFFSHLFVSDVHPASDLTDLRRSYPAARIYGVLSWEPQGLPVGMDLPHNLRFAMAFEGRELEGKRLTVEFIKAGGAASALRSAMRMNEYAAREAISAFISQDFEFRMASETSFLICSPFHHHLVVDRLEAWRRASTLPRRFRIGGADDLRAEATPGFYVMSVEDAQSFDVTAVDNLVVLSGTLPQAFVDDWASWGELSEPGPIHKKLYDYIGLTVENWGNWRGARFRMTNAITRAR